MESGSYLPFLLFFAIASVACEKYLCLTDDFAEGKAKFLDTPCADGVSPLFLKSYSQEEDIPPPYNRTNDLFMGTMYTGRAHCVTNGNNLTLVNPTFVFHNLAYLSYYSTAILCELNIKGDNNRTYGAIVTNNETMTWKDSVFHVEDSGNFKVEFVCYSYLTSSGFYTNSTYALDNVKVYSSVKEGCIDDTEMPNEKNVTVTKITKTVTTTETNSTYFITENN